MRPVRGMRIASVFAVGGLALTAAACGEAPKDDNNAGSGAKKFNACMVPDTGGVDDQSFNQSSWAGLQAAKPGEREHQDHVRRRRTPRPTTRRTSTQSSTRSATSSSRSAA